MSTTTGRTRTLVLGLALAASLAACNGSDTSDEVTAPGASTAAVGTTAPATSAPAATTVKVAVYWVGDTGRTLALYREFRDVPDVGGKIVSAVAAMTRLQPLDHDYLTPWRPASRVTVTRDGSALTVNLSRNALANTQVGSELAALAVQQLVYTATAAAQQAGTPATTVRVLVDGAPADAWGAVRLGEPTRRAAQTDVQAHAWVTSPREGQGVPTGTVRFEGYGTSFEATFGWKVLSSSGAVVAHGSAMGGTGDGRFGTFAFTASLRPGTYTVRVATDDPSGGAEGRGPDVDDKRFTVS